MKKALSNPLAQAVSDLVESFPERTKQNKRALSQLLSSDPESFSEAAMDVLKTRKASNGLRFVADLLAAENLLVSGLLAAASWNRSEAVVLAKTIAAGGTNLQPGLERALGAALGEPVRDGSVERLLRLLELLSAISWQNRVNLFQTRLMAYPDKRVQSKAALLIGSTANSATWVGRHLAGKDFRVHANSIEALWNARAPDSQAALLEACGSPNNRMAANAALGLYLLGDVRAIGVLMKLAEHADPLFQLSGLWAMGESQDQRFLPYLSAVFAESKGRTRLAATRALARIRRRRMQVESSGAMQIRMFDSVVDASGLRRLSFALCRHPNTDLSRVKPTDFSVWEGGALILDYEAHCGGHPETLAIGVVAPSYPDADPHAAALSDGLERCLPGKRPSDLWRLDWYATGARPGKPAAVEAVNQSGGQPHHGFLTDAGALREMFRMDEQSRTISGDAVAAVEKQAQAIARNPAARHIFLILDGDLAHKRDQSESWKHLEERIETDQIALHCFAPAATREWSKFHQLSLAGRGGTFTCAPAGKLPDALENAYSQLFNKFTLSYRVPPGTERGRVLLKVASDHGAGEAEIALETR